MHAPLPFTVDQVAELLQCAPDTVRELARDGVLPGLKFGRDWVFPAGALFQRLDDLALKADTTNTPQPSATLHQLPTPKARQRRQLPALPAIP